MRPPPLPDRSTRGVEPLIAAAAIVLYLGLSLRKMAAYAADGRFWAEDGMMFSKIAAMDAAHGLVMLVHGHLTLPANLVVVASSLVDFRLAPFVSTWLSFALQSIPVAMVVAFRRELGLAWWGPAVFAALLVGLPQAAEVWANPVTLQFHFTLAAALLAVLATGTGLRRHGSRALLVLCGLSGIPAHFLAPVFLAQAAITRDRERWVQFGILAGTALLQLGLLTYSGFETGGDRSLRPPLWVVWLPTVSHQVLGPLFGIGLGDQLATFLRSVPTHNREILVYALVCSVPIMALALRLREDERLSRVLVACAAVLVVASMFTARGDPMHLVSSWSGGRYFFAPNALIALYLLNLAARRPGIGIFGLIAILLVAASLRIEHYLGGPPWKQEYEAAMRSQAPKVNIWPGGWTVDVPPPRRGSPH